MLRTVPSLLLASVSLLVLQELAHAAPIQSELVPRQVAAPAADILDGTVRLPEPRAGAVRSRGAFFALAWEPDGETLWSARVQAPIARGALGFAVQAASASAFTLQLRVAGDDVSLEAPGAERRDQGLPIELGGEDVQRWDVVLAKGGIAEFHVRATGAHAPAPGFLALRDDQPLTAAAYLDTHERLADREVALVAQVERDGDGVAEERLVHAISSAWAHVEGPGYAARLPLLDDGMSGDGQAGDGRFGVRLPEGLLGEYAARIELFGNWNGADFLRTTRVTFVMDAPVLWLTGGVETEVLDARRLRLDLDALPLGNARRVQVSAEVWAHDAFGHARPMTWLSRIERPSPSPARDGHWRLPVWLDAGWFTATGLRPPLELRHLRVQDPDHQGVLASAERMPVPPGPLPPFAGRVAVPFSQLAGPSANAAIPVGPAIEIQPTITNPGLVLSHGYCSGGNVWPNTDFRQPKLAFSDPSQNRSHDEFANLIASQASAYTSFGFVGHSQGGAAALHLLTYYQSPLDRARGPRRIQSVGTPYQGTPLASLGFFACGVNSDMTPSGAATWLSGIPSWARAEVYYYTTANDGSACQFLTDLLLSNPEDGTTERSRGQLPGGHNMGHVTGWCHTTGMSDPAQYTDSSRNAILDAEAAR
ncbi:hypothetical protein Poly30_51550 [Planctomycetes bacterium Poly30]|uniref:Alpha/beta hydrolase family protein n=1 Tax=Saltatorellus ferox TaxID=2528018 RepID=A0A518EZT6_9BACT|nr:hypothetical protein Poly30_51550 [Planctomycetes bacterium Poly30]